MTHTFNNDPPVCPTHQKPMAISQFGGWYCTVRIDGQYCTERYKPYPPQNGKAAATPNQGSGKIILDKLNSIEAKLAKIEEFFIKGYHQHEQITDDLPPLS